MDEMNLCLFEVMLGYTKNRELMEINSNLECYVQTKEEEILLETNFARSTAEISSVYLNTGSSSEGLWFLGNDFDSLAVLPNTSVKFDQNLPIGENTETNILLADTRFSPLGFCYLMVLFPNQMNTCERASLTTYGSDCYINRVEFQQEIQRKTVFLEHATIQGPSFELPPERDHVPAFKCLDWPLECHEYFSRKRSWPCQRLLKGIQQDGIHVVFKPFVNKTNSNIIDPLEFVTSF